MSTPINDGGPAFPQPEAHGQQFVNVPNGPEWEQGYEHPQPGMSLRAWFAGRALPQCMDYQPPEAAEMALRYADALIVALNQPKD